jgi:small GTP-binding protein
LAKQMDNPEKFFQWLLEDEDDRASPREVVLVKKVCMLGEPAVGKTSLIRRFVYDVFDDKYIETIGAKVTKKTMRIKYIPTGQTFQLRMMIWDIAGHGALDFVKPSYYRDAEGALIVCDMTRQLTLNKVPAWIESLFTVTQAIPLIIIGNKADISDRHEFGRNEMAEISGKYRCPYLVTSAKNGDHVENAFRGMGLSLIQGFLQSRK